MRKKKLKKKIEFMPPKKCAILFPAKFDKGISYSRHDREIVKREMQLYADGRIR